jgi:hypothetical protein
MKKLITLTLSCLIFTIVTAQENIVKINALALGLSNVSLQYERSLNGNSSVALGVSYLPQRGLPGFATPDDDTHNADDFKLGGFAVTPEYRYYFKGNGPKGLYLAGYFRYSKYKTDDYEFSYDKSDGTTGKSIYSGDFKTTVVGLMLGSQFLLGENWTLDWWIIGAGFGSQKGEYTATGTFSDQDQQDIKTEVGTIDSDAIKVSVETSATSAKITMEPKFPAFRGFGLCLGYRF